MSLRPTGRNKVLVTDANGKIVSQTNQSSADMTIDEMTATTVTANLVGNVTGNITGDVTGNSTGGVTLTAAVLERAPVVDNAAHVLTAAQSGTTFVATSAATTTVFTLPAVAAGLNYTFICGHADGEILVNSNAGETIIGKGFSVTTGIKNTTATNVVGDTCKLVCDGTNWKATVVTGTWATQ